MKSSIRQLFSLEALWNIPQTCVKFSPFKEGVFHRIPQDSYTETLASSKFHITNGIRILAQYILTLKQILDNLQNLRHVFWPQSEKPLFTKEEDEQGP